MRTRTLVTREPERDEEDPDGPFVPDPERYDPSAPEFASVEAFVQWLMDDERDSYTTEEAQVLGQSLRRVLPGLHAELQSWGLTHQRREVPRAKGRGFNTSSLDRWYGKGSCKTHGGSGWEVISGFVGEASSPGLRRFGTGVPCLVAYKDKTRAAAYSKAWHLKRKAALSQDLCACGCGLMHKVYQSSTKHPTRYIRGHYQRMQKGVLKLPRVLVDCACGCGEVLASRNRHGNKQRYIYGHQRRRYETVKLTPTLSKKEVSVPQSRASKWARKMTVLRHYSGDEPSCACCGEQHVEFLALDHVHGGGNAHRKQTGTKGGAAFYAWIVKNGYPSGYRVLCHNCNMAYGIWGCCPHQVVPENESSRAAGGSGGELITGFVGDAASPG